MTLAITFYVYEKPLFNTHAHAHKRYMLKYPNTLFLIRSP